MIDAEHRKQRKFHKPQQAAPFRVRNKKPAGMTGYEYARSVAYSLKVKQQELEVSDGPRDQSKAA
jgi:hypothetical protein